MMASPVSAEPDPPLQLEGLDEELRQILQSSLSIVEIDQEIERIGEKLNNLQQKLMDTELLLYEQEIDIEEKRVQAGRVLTAYYKGERVGIYLSLLQVENFEQLLHSWELLEHIMRRDRDILTTYKEQYEELLTLYEQFAYEQEQLQLMEQQLQQQRKRVLALEQEIDEQLSGRSDAERVAMLIKQLTEHWQQEGIVQVKTYFNKLALAMNDLPKWLQRNKQYMSNKGFTYTITLPQDALNEYLRNYDPMFDAFEFKFQDDKIVAYGENDQLSVEISGQYSIVNEPENYIQFTIEDLLFNGFTLPDTTRAQLEQQFDLNFYPGAILKLLKATSVEVTEGKLTIVLKLSL